MFGSFCGPSSSRPASSGGTSYLRRGRQKRHHLLLQCQLLPLYHARVCAADCAGPCLFGASTFPRPHRNAGCWNGIPRSSESCRLLHLPRSVRPPRGKVQVGLQPLRGTQGIKGCRCGARDYQSRSSQQSGAEEHPDGAAVTHALPA